MRESQLAVRVRRDPVPGDSNTGAFDGMCVFATETLITEPIAPQWPSLDGVERGRRASEAFGGVRS